MQFTLGSVEAKLEGFLEEVLEFPRGPKQVMLVIRMESRLHFDSFGRLRSVTCSKVCVQSFFMRGSGRLARGREAPIL